MSGLLSGLLVVVGIVGAIMTGGALGVLAGALMATSFAAQQGWLGGGMKNFFKSGVGQDLTMAVGLASAAGGAYEALTSGAEAAQTASVAQSSVNAGAQVTPDAVDVAGATAGAGAAPGAAGAANASAGFDAMNAEAVGTSNGFIVQNGTPGLVNNMVTGVQEQNLAAGGVQTLQQMNQADASAASSGQIPGLSPEQQQAAIQAGTPGQVTNPNSGQNINMNQPQNPISPVAPSSQASATQTGIDQSAVPGTFEQPSAGTGTGTPAAPQSQPGMLSKAADYIGKNPGVGMMAGSALSGLAQGAMQQKMMQEEIAAQQWGNMQWEQPGQVARMQAAAAQPITVPSGYLTRAQNVANLVNGNSSSNGPIMGPQPGSATVPTQVTPPQASAPGGGPVPVLGMGATPRGGMV